MRFHLQSFIIFLLLFVLEVLIEKTTGFIRYTFGDFLVVILLYYLVKSFFTIAPEKLAIGVLVFAFLIEGLQAIHFIELIGLQEYKIAHLLLGNTFVFTDLIAYTLGIITVYFIEKRYEKIK